MEGPGLDLADVVHAQIPREREKRGKSKSQSMRAFLMFFENAQRRKIINVSDAFFIWKSILASRE